MAFHWDGASEETSIKGVIERCKPARGIETHQTPLDRKGQKWGYQSPLVREPWRDHHQAGAMGLKEHQLLPGMPWRGRQSWAEVPLPLPLLLQPPIRWSLQNPEAGAACGGQRPRAQSRAGKVGAEQVVSKRDKPAAVPLSRTLDE